MFNEDINIIIIKYDKEEEEDIYECYFQRFIHDRTENPHKKINTPLQLTFPNTLSIRKSLSSKQKFIMKIFKHFYS